MTTPPTSPATGTAPVGGTNPTPATPAPVIGTSPATPSVLKSKVRPADPLMGSTEETYSGSGSYYYAFGGKPKFDWSGLDPTSNRIMTDLSLRPLDPVTGQKSSIYRRAGLSKKFAQAHNLSTFQKKVWDHLVKYGLDTMAYLPDPSELKTVLPVVTHHARFTGDINKATTSSINLQKKFDLWDMKHDNEAKSFLLDSIDDDILRGLEPFQKTEDTFAITWLKLVHYLVTTTAKTYDDMKAKLRSKRPQQYSGQNIEQMSSELMIIAKELDNAGYYAHSLTLNIVDSFLNASQDQQGTFHHALNTLRTQVDDLVQETVFLAKADQDLKFASRRLTYTDVCLKAVKCYRDLVHNSKWEPAKLPKDRQAPASVHLSKADILLLIENSGSRGKGGSRQNPRGANQSGGKPATNSKGKCFNCGSEDHQIKDCPKPKTPKSNQSRQSNMAKWKLTAPKSGESSTKEVNGRTFYWCAKCGNWSPTHGTDSHTGKSAPKSNTPPTYLAALDASAWLVDTDVSASCPISISNVILYLYMVLSLWMLSGLPTPQWNDLLSGFSDLCSVSLKSWYQLLPFLSWSNVLVLMAPVTWFICGYAACYWTHSNPEPFNPIDHSVVHSRLVRRAEAKQKKPKWKLKSIKGHRLCKSYPHRLRKENVFNTRSATPTLNERKFGAMIDDWISDHQGSIQQPRPTRQHSHHPKKAGGRKHWKNHWRHSKSMNRQHDVMHRQPHAFGPFCQPLKYKVHSTTTPRHLPSHKFTTRQGNSIRNRAAEVWMLGAKVGHASMDMAKSVALLAPLKFKAALNISSQPTSKCKTHAVVWDTGASICITPDKEDFISYSTDSDLRSVKGMSGSATTIAGKGKVLWSIHDANGMLRQFKLEAYHVPSAKIRLISTSTLLNTYQGEHLTVSATALELSGIPGDATRSPVIAYNNPINRLPTTTVYRYDDTDLPAIHLNETISTVHQSNLNLSESEKELLRWHQRLGHLSFKKIQHLMRTGVLSHTEGTRALHTAASKLRSPPKCAACLFGKQTTRHSPGTKTSVISDRSGILRAGNLFPGSEVSVDHFVSSVKGRLFSGFNRGSDANKFIGGCIFVDHSSSYIHIEFQDSLSSHDTLRAKMAFEKMGRDQGVTMQRYMSDNGTAFTSRDFTEHLSSYHQVSKFAGVGAHHHNAQAERSIRTIMSIARAMMLHSGIHWPDMANPTLWPMAVSHACFLWNHVPDPSTGLTPSDLFTKTRWPQKKFHDLHVWGCPIYVLDKSLQDGKKIPKWKPRSNRTVYMGVSPSHASSVPLVLNPSTGSITPQFHVVFDDWFATVSSGTTSPPDFSSDDWYKMFGSSRYQYVLDPEDEEKDEHDSDTADFKSNERRVNEISSLQDAAHPPQPLPVDQPPSESSPSPLSVTRRDNHDTSDRDSSNTLGSVTIPPIPPSIPSSPIQRKSEPLQSSQSSQPPLQRKSKASVKISPRRSTRLASLDRSSRSNQPIQRLTYTHDKKSFTNITYMYSKPEEPAVHHCIDMFEGDYAQVYASSAAVNPDNFDYDTAMNGEHRQDWIDAAKKEIQQLESLKCWDEVPMDSVTAQVLPGTWVFRVKRGPDGSFKKFKARYCIRGDLQVGDFETYAPVVQFSSVRLFLALSLLLNWYSCSIDFSNAFIQANLDEPTFIHLPRGFTSTLRGRSCLKLNKSIYGLSVAPRLWFQHLLKALKKLGLVQSKHDPCLMMRPDLIVICYVDDLGLQAPKKQIVDKLIENLQKMGFELTRDGTFSEYLGIMYTTLDDGSINMTQQGLIQKIMDATGMQDCNPNRTPSTKEALGLDPDGSSMDDSWNYRSIVGMLLYLATNTRPDIAFAVSQVARFSHYPKKSHATAVKTIIRYLSGTKSNGVIFKQPTKLSLDCYVDADFAGLYNQEPHCEPTSVKSRTGYIISVGNCFILCKSQLQSMVALSTSESEYGALSQAMRVVLPLREILQEVITTVDMVNSEGVAMYGSRLTLHKFPSIIYEDNAAALALAMNQKVTSRTKHWSVKFHFFWEHINDERKNIKCVKVDTKLQRADYLTKGLTRELFENCRKLNQGW